MTAKATIRAKRGAANAAEWAKPGVDMARVWMAVRMYRGSAAVQKKVAPKVASVMADTGKKLYPRKRSRFLPAIISGAALAAAGAAAAAAIITRNKRMAETLPPPPMPSSAGDQGPPAREAEVNGLSRTR